MRRAVCLNPAAARAARTPARLLRRRCEASPALAGRLAPRLAAGVARGFTLLELLVAITVLSVVSLIAWRGLDSLVHTRDRLLPQAEEVRDLLVAFGQIERDLAQVVNAAIMPLDSPPLVARAAGLELMRTAPRAEGVPTALQFVAYEVRDGRLLRLASAPMATLRAPAGALIETPLLDGVQALRVRVWQPGSGWAPPAAGAGRDPRRPPPGVELVLERSDGREYRRVLLVGNG
jgi:general secretion pathway protein J